MATLHFDIPAYAQDMIWITFFPGLPQKSSGKPIAIPDDTGHILLHWGTENGAPLIQLPIDTQEIRWTGSIGVKGHVEATHIMSVDELDLMVIEVSGGLIPDGFTRLPSLEDLKQNTFRRDSFYSGEQDEHWYAFLLPLESPLVDFAHHALVNGHAVDCYGSLADEQAELHKMVGMPFLLESMSLYG